jgi:hypothetical protein
MTTDRQRQTKERCDVSVLVGRREVGRCRKNICDGADIGKTGTQVNANTVGLQVVRSLSLTLRIETYISELCMSTIFIPPA